MESLDEFLAGLRERGPGFDEQFEEAKAELRLGLLLNSLRESRGWTQRELAERAGMPQSAVARYEKAGRTPSVTVLWRFAKALGVSLVLGPDLSVQAVDRQAEPQLIEPIPEDKTAGREVQEIGSQVIKDRGQALRILQDYDHGQSAAQERTPR